MLKVRNEVVNTGRGQWNSARRAFDVDGTYCEVMLWKEGNSWDGQRRGTLTIFVTPGNPQQIMFTYPPEVHVSTHGPDETARVDDMVRALDFVSEQAESWVREYLV